MRLVLRDRQPGEERRVEQRRRELADATADLVLQLSVDDGSVGHEAAPEGAGSGTDAGRRYGAYAMEVLINDCLKAGGRREQLEAKLFGGGRMFDSLKDVGRANADFAERFLRDEGIAVVGGSLRGSGGRRVQYWPASGRALQRAVTDRQLPAATVRPFRPASPVDAGTLELF